MLDSPALEQAAAVRRREVSPVELAAACLERVERLAATVGAFVTVTAEAALDAARAAERAVLSGAELGPLHGVPTAVKDLNLVAGLRTTFGSAAFRDFLAPVDDHVVTRLRAGGLVSLGKTNTPEFGLPCYTEPDVAPPARSPWDLDRTAGGSSGGAAAAVAAGLVPVAQGSDGGGSIRIPASCCGLVGLKPARGRVSLGPLAGELTGLPVVGPIARTVRDAAALLDVMAGPFPGDPSWAPPPGEPFLVACERDPGRLRIGRYSTPVVSDVPVAAACVAAWEDVSALLEELGHVVEDVSPPFGPDVVPSFETVWAVSAALALVPAEAEPLLRPLTRWLRERGRATSAVDFGRAVTQMQLAARSAVTATSGYDAVLVPALASLPPRVGEMRDDADPAADFEAQKRFTPFTAAYNVTGQPAITLPLHVTAEDFPVSVMLVGRPADEARLLALAAQLEAARPWAHRRPPLG